MRLRPTGKEVTSRVRKYWQKGDKQKAREVLEKVFQNIFDEDVESVGNGRCRVESRSDTGYWFVHKG